MVDIITMQQLTKAEQQNQTSPPFRPEFYQLHYPPRRQSNSPNRQNHKFRAKSLSSVIRPLNPEEIMDKLRPVLVKGSLRNRIVNEPLSLRIEKLEKSTPTIYSMLSSSNHSSIIEWKQHPISNPKTLDEKSRKSSTLRNAVQLCKQQKLKISKLVQSYKQAEEVKLVYIELKKKDVEKEIQKETKLIYDHFFRKQYEMMYGNELGASQFETKLKGALEGIHTHLFH